MVLVTGLELKVTVREFLGRPSPVWSSGVFSVALGPGPLGPLWLFWLFWLLWPV